VRPPALEWNTMSREDFSRERHLPFQQAAPVVEPLSQVTLNL